jgi:hypothetical protein
VAGPRRFSVGLVAVVLVELRLVKHRSEVSVFEAIDRE